MKLVNQHFLHGTRSFDQRGMTLVEVLVTLVIISIGLLGVAALQLTSLRNNYDSYVRSQAAVLAGDILDRMRANRTAALSDADPYTVDTKAFTATGTPAQRDITDWKATLAAQLPSGVGSITRNDAAGTFTIVIQWGERDNTDDGTTVMFQTSSAI